MKEIILINLIVPILTPIVLVILFNFFYVKKHEKFKEFIRKINVFYSIPILILIIADIFLSNLLISFILCFITWICLSFQWLGIYYSIKYRKELMRKHLNKVDENIKKLFINKEN
jgi:uncharacterized protein YacL